MSGAAPWWYRSRVFIVLGIYLAGFFGGEALTKALGLPVHPLLVDAGKAVHPHQVALFAWVATAFTVFGWLLRAWGSAYLSARVVWDPGTHDERLIVDGPFHFVRNPLYLGMILLSVGIGALATPIGFAVIVVGNIIVSVLLIGEEQAALAKHFGAVFEAYRATVPSLIPRLTPAHVPGTIRAHPSLMEGFKAELLTGTFALCDILLTAGFSQIRPFMYLLLVLGVATSYIARRR